MKIEEVTLEDGRKIFELTKDGKTYFMSWDGKNLPKDWKKKILMVEGQYGTYAKLDKAKERKVVAE
tara:strand:+ start:59 stop:256 length:198 start_codon:yes stop_codon:yes gene_type:complete